MTNKSEKLIKLMKKSTLLKITQQNLFKNLLKITKSLIKSQANLHST